MVGARPLRHRPYYRSGAEGSAIYSVDQLAHFTAVEFNQDENAQCFTGLFGATNVVEDCFPAVAAQNPLYFVCRRRIRYFRGRFQLSVRADYSPNVFSPSLAVV
ncbi:Uncharacterised protein [Vibrio cholerae]|uniref:Uncharacterized protein n=1 Tax=Vibrio cholerae TaxID=666 RepID=A0A656APC1_VIBCL|nr:Uncharacterised protein [Vibrio cholerae]CSB07439.1 Uncharacterised protein [Vibrio cholerae]CSB19471.1 Uncharacterised protein [Vibrio cholerae]CSB83384.1 Uncharacterised protein [Vibrio cholerae]CSC14601.1 Uncharacterised protein [Vibrio cholerae]